MNGVNKSFYNLLSRFRLELKKNSHEIEKDADYLYMDLLEATEELVRKKADSDTVYTKKFKDTKNDSIIGLYKSIIRYSKSKDIENIITALVYLEVRLEHAEYHIKESRTNINRIIRKLEKLLPPENELRTNLTLRKRHNR